MGKVYRAALAAEKRAAKAVAMVAQRHVVTFTTEAVDEYGRLRLYCSCGDEEYWDQDFRENLPFSDLVEWAETHSNCEACGLSDDECQCSCECCCECKEDL